MAVNIEELRQEATQTVLDLMLAQYEDADADAMRQFAAIIAEAAAAAVEHMIARSQTAVSGEGLI